ncbi:hypothetical protein [Methylococcus mesophilus]|uniref:hypothetical protein n=1 Tax=Methylococcus mesophilus TaxID=2993564 RepID=UPI00224B95D3|nr:hypothetical protein [Methylococcus mesophilus]UZR27893.1 hypothetical protein OOT43_14360 [Methylococcus mesophilus]
MAKVTVTRCDDSTFEVVVEDAAMTSHTVTVDPSYAAKLAGGVPVEMLVRRSFDFLLEREPNLSILRQFELSLIGRYFPEYERVIRGMLS